MFVSASKIMNNASGTHGTSVSVEVSVGSGVAGTLAALGPFSTACWILVYTSITLKLVISYF